MNAPAGQAARNAWFDAEYGQQPPKGSYAMLAGKTRNAWDQAAKAGARDLRDALAGLATEMHAEADEIAAGDEHGRVLRAQVLHEYASRIRQVLGPEAP